MQLSRLCPSIYLLLFFITRCAYAQGRVKRLSPSICLFVVKNRLSMLLFHYRCKHNYLNTVHKGLIGWCYTIYCREKSLVTDSAGWCFSVYSADPNIPYQYTLSNQSSCFHILAWTCMFGLYSCLDMLQHCSLVCPDLSWTNGNCIGKLKLTFPASVSVINFWARWKL